MTLKKRSKGQGGFTLIELVAVVIILGILAAVIVPKYFDMTGKAQDGAYRGALSEGVARLNMAYAQYIMDVGSKPANLASLQVNSTYLGTSAAVSIGDYTITYGGGSGTGSAVTAVTMALSKTGTTGTLNYSNSSAATLSVTWPGN